MTIICTSVGERGINRNSDVRLVQILLNCHIKKTGGRVLEVDGICGFRTIDAIKQFQKIICGRISPDGRVEPYGATLHELNIGSIRMLFSKSQEKNLSGAIWWKANESKYRNSSKIEDLETVFQGKVKKFISAMHSAGASVIISSTKRDRIRAYLMHYSWKISKGLVNPSSVPSEPGCSIKWDHGNDAVSRKAAADMVRLFRIVYMPSLESLHISGRAIDMTITWNREITIKDEKGKNVILKIPSSGNENIDLQQVGASYGVFKLRTDPPHWSSNGH